MTIALFADIHSNYAALEACLSHLEKIRVDALAFLGDYVSDGPYPQRTLDLLREAAARYETWLVRGNREEYFIDYHRSPGGWRDGSARGSLLYTYENLTEEDIGFFEALPVCRTVRPDGCAPFTICHGSPENTREALFPGEANTDRALEALDTRFLLCGHTHRPCRYEHGGRVLIGCGSVGAPTNGQTDAQFTVITSDGDGWRDTLVSVPYDVERYIADYAASGLLDRGQYWSKSMIRLLRTGFDGPQYCLDRACELAAEAGEPIPPSGPPERYWVQAAAELGIV